MKNRLSQVQAKLESAVSDASDGSAILELSMNIADLVEGSLRERPIATLALVAGGEAVSRNVQYANTLKERFDRTVRQLISQTAADVSAAIAALSDPAMKILE